MRYLPVFFLMIVFSSCEKKSKEFSEELEELEKIVLLDEEDPLEWNVPDEQLISQEMPHSEDLR